MSKLADLQRVLTDPNVQAFLRVIRAGESSSTSDEAYRALFGWKPGNGKTFESFDDHPRQAFMSAWGWTSAAGAYQAMCAVPGKVETDTWGDFIRDLGPRSFSPSSQDLFAVWCINRRHALADVVAGRIVDAIKKCGDEWASLPGSRWGQPQRTLQQALDTYAKWGGKLAPAEPLPAPARPPAPEQPPDVPPTPAAPAPAPINQPEKPTMLELIQALGRSLIGALTPLAAEKIQKEIGRHVDNPEVAQQITAAVVDAAVQATGKTDPIEAVAAAKADPAALAQVEQSALDKLASMAPLFDKLADLDERAWAAEEASRDAARKHNADDPLLIDAPWVKLKFIHVLSLLFVAFSGWFVTMNWGSLTPELRGSVITLMVIAGWNGVRDYWMGSSRSSAAKDVVIGELTRKRSGSQ